MTFKELNFFYKLCEDSKVSSVANELGISQSAISIAIKSLEEKLGEQLFDRIGKKLILNERGRVFFQKTYPHFTALQDAQNMFQKSKLKGKLKLASSKTISYYIIPTLYYQFLNRYKEVKLEPQTLNSKDIIKKVVAGELDLGLIETKCDEVDIIHHKLLDDELIVVTSDPNYKKKQYIDSVKKKWVLRESGSGTKEIFFNTLGELSKQIDIFMELNEVEEIKQVLLGHKDTISTISKLVVKKELEEKKLFEIKLHNFEFKREFLLIYHKSKTQTLLFQTFVEFLQKHFQTIKQPINRN